MDKINIIKKFHKQIIDNIDVNISLKKQFRIECNKCKKRVFTKLRNLDRIRRNYYLCKDCVRKEKPTKEQRIKISKKLNKYYEDNPGIVSNRLKKSWSSKEYRNKIIKHLNKINKDPELIKRRMKTRAITLEYTNLRKVISNNSKRLWQTSEFRNKIIGSLANSSKVSVLQEQLYLVLDNLDIKYYREYCDKLDDPEVQIGINTSKGKFLYSFDCVIPKQFSMIRDLLIEVQGGPHYFDNNTISRDQSKAKIVKKYLSNEYDLKYLWSHDFKTSNKIIELIKYWVGINELEMVDFNFLKVVVNHIKFSDYSTFLGAYHYLPSAKAGISYGAFFNKELIAVCVFSPLIRQNIKINKFMKSETRELSRLCIHPKYQKKNFASWFVNKCVKLLDDKYKCIISYADTTFNHDGTVYKALGWKQDRIIKPDYWYVDVNGNITSKRALYGHAIKSKISEREFAEKFGFKRIFGYEKFRFVHERS